MQVAADELRRAGWARVVRTAHQKSWDYEVSSGSKSARVEVKGSTLPIRSIEVTRNEHDSALTFAHPILVLVSDIDLRRGDLVAEGGIARIVDPWRPAERDFVAQRYTYQVPTLP
jgi:hypothetical protein